MKIEKDYTLTITAPDNTIIMELSLKDYNLSKSIACGSVCCEIDEAIRIAEGKTRVY